MPFLGRTAKAIDRLFGSIGAGLVERGVGYGMSRGGTRLFGIGLIHTGEAVRAISESPVMRNAVIGGAIGGIYGGTVGNGVVSGALGGAVIGGGLTLGHMVWTNPKAFAGRAESLAAARVATKKEAAEAAARGAEAAKTMGPSMKANEPFIPLTNPKVKSSPWPRTVRLKRTSENSIIWPMSYGTGPPAPEDVISRRLVRPDWVATPTDIRTIGRRLAGQGRFPPWVDRLPGGLVRPTRGARAARLASIERPGTSWIQGRAAVRRAMRMRRIRRAGLSSRDVSNIFTGVL